MVSGRGVWSGHGSDFGSERIEGLNKAAALGFFEEALNWPGSPAHAQGVRSSASIAGGSRASDRAPYGLVDGVRPAWQTWNT